MSNESSALQGGQVRIRVARIFGLVGLAQLLPLFLNAVRYVSRTPQVLGRYSSTWSAIVLALAGLLLLSLAFNLRLWLSFDSKPVGGPGRRMSAFRGRWRNLFAAALLSLLFGAGLGWLQTWSGEGLALGFFPRLLGWATLTGLAVVCLRMVPGSSSPSDSPASPGGSRMAIGKDTFNGMNLFVVFVLAAMGIFLYVHSGVSWQGMLGDQTLDVYAAVTIANGQAPYEGFILLHPPLAYLPSALFIWLGRVAGMEDLMAARLGSLLMFLMAAALTYRAALRWTRNSLSALLAACASGWLLAGQIIATGSPTKIIFMLASLIMIVALQERRWFLGGLAAAAASLAWGGGFVVLPVPLICAIAELRRERGKQLASVLSGMLLGYGMVAAYLLAEGTLGTFYQQFVVSTFRLIAAKANPAVTPYPALAANPEASLFRGFTGLAAVDRAMFLAGILSLVAFFRAFPVKVRALRWVASDPDPVSSAPVVLLSLAGIALSLVDFQSSIDIAPLIAPFAVVSAWGAERLLAQMVSDEARPSVARWMYFIALLSVLWLNRAVTPPKEVVPSLETQRLNADWYAMVAVDGDEAQWFGDLSIPLLLGRSNLSRLVHLGPKTVTALEAEGVPLGDYYQRLLELQPEFVYLDYRNLSLPYVAPLLESLSTEYLSVPQSSERVGAGNLYVRNDAQSRGPLLALGYDFLERFPELFRADLLFQSGDFEAALKEFQSLDGTDRRLNNYLLIRIAETYVALGKPEEAESLFKRAGRQAPYKTWGLLAGASGFREIGRSRFADEALARAFGEGVPEALLLEPPFLFTPAGLLSRPSVLYVPVGEKLFLLGCDGRTTDDGRMLITLWWWSPHQDSPEIGDILLQWVSSDGTPIGTAGTTPTYFYPGLGSTWSYLVDAPPEPGPLMLTVGLIEDGEVSSVSQSVEVSVVTDESDQ